MKDQFDAVIIGAGLAGLHCARLLAQGGAKVMLVDRKTDLTRAVHTTGIFVRRTLEDFELPPGTLGPPVRNVSLFSPGLRRLDLASEHEEFRVGKMGVLYCSLLKECEAAGVEILLGARYVSSELVNPAVPGNEVSTVKLESQGRRISLRTKVLIGADGANSRVARDLRLDENKEWIVGYEEVFRAAATRSEPHLYCFLDAELAPGYLAWLADDGEELHVGVGGYPSRFDPRDALDKFKRKAARALDLEFGRQIEARGGRIPVGGVLRRIANRRGLLIGDAAGAVSPLTAGGLDPCMRMSTFAAEIVLERLVADEAGILVQFSGKRFRSRFFSRLWMRRMIAAVTSQNLLEMGTAALRSPIGRRLARHVFFGRGSFPDLHRNAGSVLLKRVAERPE